MQRTKTRKNSQSARGVSQQVRPIVAVLQRLLHIAGCVFSFLIFSVVLLTVESTILVMSEERCTASLGMRWFTRTTSRKPASNTWIVSLLSPTQAAVHTLNRLFI